MLSRASCSIRILNVTTKPASQLLHQFHTALKLPYLPLSHQSTITRSKPEIPAISSVKASYHSTSSSDMSQSTINEVIDFYTSTENTKKWFIQDSAFDQEIRSQFGSFAALARTGSLDNLTTTPQGTLVLIILLDQFSRNLHRGSPDSYSADPKALQIALQGIADGYDLQLPLRQQVLFYLPLMHDETLVSQVAAKALYEGFARRCQESGEKESVDFAKQAMEACISHMKVVRRFGRYPSRNKVLSRESTEEEEAFLKETPRGF